MAAGFPLVLSGSEFVHLPSWRCNSESLRRLRSHFSSAAADLAAKSAMAGACAAETNANLDTALKCELLGLLKARERQLSNPVVFEILELGIEVGNWRSRRKRRKGSE